MSSAQTHENLYQTLAQTVLSPVCVFTYGWGGG